MRRKLRSRPLLLLGITMSVIILTNWAVNLQCQRTYSSLINNQAIVNAFYNGDQEKIAQAIKDPGLAYQRVEAGKIVFSSRSWLPTPTIVSYQQTFLEGVIKPNLYDSLVSRQHYRIFKGASIYVMAPICTSDCYSEMYIVYQRAVL